MSIELTAVKAGINRLRDKGKARADSLHTLTNGYVTAARTIRSRPGTARHASLLPGTKGLVAFDGKFHVFASAPWSASIPLDANWTGDPGFAIAGGQANFVGGMLMSAMTGGGNQNMVVVSEDGINWQADNDATFFMQSSGAPPAWSDSLGIFLIVRAGLQALSYKSTDGLTWTEHVMNTTLESNSLIWVEELQLFVCGTEGANPIWTSADGVTWTQRTSGTFTASGLAYSNTLNQLVAVGGTSIVYSADGVTWTSAVVTVTGLSSVVWSPELAQFVAIGSGQTAISSDGINWTVNSIAEPDDATYIAWSPALNIFCAVEAPGVGATQAYTSPDGIIWTQRALGSHSAGGITWASHLGLFVVMEASDPGATQNNAWTSPDGIAWTERSLPAETDNEDWSAAVVGSVLLTPKSLTNNTVHFAAPGRSYTATAGVKSASPTFGGRVGITWYNSAGGVISTTYAAAYTVNTGVLFVDSTLTATAPALTAGASVAVQANGGPVEFKDVFTSFVATGTTEFLVHALLHPDNQALKKIHFAAPFLAALYVVAEFVDDSVYHYWLQDAEAWQASHEYSANEFVTPTIPNGLVYRATRLGSPNQSWAPNVPRALNDLIEPTVYNEYYFKATAVNGTSPRSASVEPVWPTNSGETIVENSESEEPDENTSVTPPAPPSPNAPQSATLDKYLRSGRVGLF